MNEAGKPRATRVVPLSGGRQAGQQSVQSRENGPEKSRGSFAVQDGRGAQGQTGRCCNVARRNASRTRLVKRRVSRDIVAQTMMESCTNAATEAMRRDVIIMRSVQDSMGIAAPMQMG